MSYATVDKSPFVQVSDCNNMKGSDVVLEAAVLSQLIAAA